MDTKSQETFNEIIAMDKETLTQEQWGFLMARRGYMNDEQRARYAKEIKLHEAGKLLTGESDEDESEEGADEGEEVVTPKKKASRKK